MKTIKTTILLITLVLFSATTYSQNIKSTLNTNSLGDLTLVIDGNGYQDQVDVMYDSAATKGFDSAFDMYKLFGLYAAPQIYSFMDSTTKLSINALPPFTHRDTVQLGFRVGKDTAYKITASGINTFPALTYIMFHDNKQNTTILLNQQPIYNFTGDTADSPKRFIIYFVNTTSINEIIEGTIRIYSLNNNIFINSDNSTQIKEIEIYDINGKSLFMNHSLNCTSYNVDMNSKAKKMYFVRIKTSNSVFTKKIILR